VRSSLRRGVDRVLAADMIWSGAFIVTVVLLLMPQSCTPEVESLLAGQLAPHDIRAPLDYDWIDQTLTEERRRQAREAVDEVHVHDPSRGLRLARGLASIFEHGRLAAEQGGPSDAPVAVPPAALAVLSQLRFDVSIERRLTAALQNVLAARIVANKSLLEREPSLTLVQVPGGQPLQVRRYDGFLDLSEARAAVRQEVLEQLLLEPAQEQVLAELAASFVDANVHYDPQATEQRRQEAARAQPPVMVRVDRGDVLVRRGEPLTADVVARVEDALRASARPLGLRELLALLFLASLVAFFLYRYSRYHQRGFRKIQHLHALLLLLLISTLLLARGMLWLAGKVVGSLEPPYAELGHYAYLVPIGAGAILVALLANGRIATVHAAFAALLFGAMNGWDGYLMLWAMLVQCAGVYAISTYRERSALLRAGLVVGGAGAAAVVALETVRGSLEPLSGTLYAAALAATGGAVGVGLLVSFSLPLLEGLFNALTDIRLLELSNVNHPLLSELAVKAPGSYNHSVVVGTLAEEAAKVIGANSLFCRVAAFYHDVGKINKPDYYVENQRGDNPHDRLSPSMSALIITSHVKDGIKLAREAGLPEQIVDIIPQHHGTKLMSYFYEKAKASADPALGPVNHDDFRYPGPKPQTREAAIFMLADAVEAAARTVEEPTANRLREMIRQVTNAIVLDGQLDSCDLTFADLEKIQEAFLRSLVSMYHHRVDYPGFDFGRPRGDSRETEPGKARVGGGKVTELRNRRA
jgi:putative nucleotidyltransferase with HDIG domain